MFVLISSTNDPRTYESFIDHVYGPYEAHEVEKKKKLLEAKRIYTDIHELLDVY